jgi:hypothetical protein
VYYIYISSDIIEEGNLGLLIMFGYWSKISEILWHKFYGSELNVYNSQQDKQIKKDENYRLKNIWI